MTLQAVLFDLDGTLLDTAPDMGGARNELRAEYDLSPLPAAEVRPLVSIGAAALVRLGFGDREPGRFEPRRLRFLETHAGRLAHETRLFEGGDALLAVLDAANVPSGIVTIKPGWLTAPLLLAAATVGRRPDACVYLDDAEGDMQGVLATFGYLDPQTDWSVWPHVATISQLAELLPWMGSRGLAAALPEGDATPITSS